MMLDTAQGGPRGILSDQAYTQLKKALKTGAYAPGQKITIRATALALGMSTMPIREAFRRLVAEGALENEPNRSVRVPSITPEKLREITKVRMAAEGLAAQEAALRPVSTAFLDRLEDLQLQMAAAKDRRDYQAYMAGNEAFHFAIYRAAEMPILLGVIEGLWLRAGPYLSLLLPQMRGMDLHHTIIEALRNGDGLNAREAMAKDIERASENLLRLLDGVASRADGASAR